MKLSYYKYPVKISRLVKVIILIMLITSAPVDSNGQNSGLNIGAISEVTVDPRGPVSIKGIEQSTAVLRKLVNEAKKQEIVATKDPIASTKKEITTEKPIKKELPVPVVTTSGTIYDIPGATAIHQYTSLQASFKFLYELHGLSPQQYQTFNVTQAIELYKLEKGTSTRSFCIPSGSCSSVNIPIQITGNGLRGGPVSTSSGGAARSPYSCFTVVFPSGYLEPGEYAFIDKSSLKPDGTALICFVFTVKQ